VADENVYAKLHCRVRNKYCSWLNLCPRYSTWKILDIVTYRPVARQLFGKHIPAVATPATKGRPLLGNGSVNKPCQQQRGCFLRGPCRGVIKGQRRSLERVVVENWVQFWRLQSKITEKKWQERELGGAEMCDLK
jgi:hypothetical protein